MSKKLIIYMCFFLCSCTHTTLNWQNDVFNKSDDDFSNGVELTYRANPSQLNETLKRGLSKFPAPRLSSTDPKEVSYYKFSLRQDMYTPDDLKATEVVQDENPYAGTLTLDTEKVMSSSDKRISTKIRLGTSGEYSFADRTQIFIHDTLTDLGRNQTHPAGWDNQIDAEPLLNIDYQRAWESYRLQVGDFDFVGQGDTTTRLGNINTDLTIKYGWKLGYNVPTLDLTVKEELSLYTLLNGFSIGRVHNIYYDGGLLRESKHTVDKEYVVSGLESGVGFIYKNYAIKFIHIVQTNNYKEQDGSVQKYSSLVFGVNW